MPHLFTNRPRVFNPLSKAPGHLKQLEFSWELANALIYLVGGLSFIVGSVFFFPALESLSNVGAWIFFGGSLLYLVVTVHDLIEAITYRVQQHHYKRWYGLELAAALIYISGTVLFAVGSLLFLPQIDSTALGGWCFIIGSALFLIGACVNVMQIIDSPSMTSLQLVNATAITFALGSAIFLVASVPYLWPKLHNPASDLLGNYMAAEYAAGSGLFMLGGGFNLWRARMNIRKRRERSDDDGQQDPSQDSGDSN